MVNPGFWLSSLLTCDFCRPGGVVWGRGGAETVQLALQLSDEVIFSVQLQLQLIDEGVTLQQLLNLSLQGKLEVTESSHQPVTAGGLCIYKSNEIQ